MTGAKTWHQHQMYRYHRSSDEIWTMRLHETLEKKSNPTTNHIRQTTNRYWHHQWTDFASNRSWWTTIGMVKGELPESTFQETNKNEVNSMYKLYKSVEYIKLFP